MWNPMLNCTSKKSSKMGMLWMFHVPCFIDADSVEKSTEFTFERAFDESELGILQILASLENNLNEARVNRSTVELSKFLPVDLNCSK